MGRIADRNEGRGRFFRRNKNGTWNYSESMVDGTEIVLRLIRPRVLLRSGGGISICNCAKGVKKKKEEEG